MDGKVSKSDFINRFIRSALLNVHGVWIFFFRSRVFLAWAVWMNRIMIRLLGMLRRMGFLHGGIRPSGTICWICLVLIPMLDWDEGVLNTCFGGSMWCFAVKGRDRKIGREN
jgi:hypothetical protein